MSSPPQEISVTTDELLAGELPRQRQLSLRLLAVRGRMAEIAAAPDLQLAASVDLSGHSLSDADLEILCRSPHLAELSRLDVHDNQLGPAAVSALARLPALAELDLRDNQLGDAGAAALASTGLAARLLVLALARNQLSREGTRSLSTVLAGLARLDLSGQQLGDQLATLAARLGPRLTWLRLEYTDANAQAMEALASGPAAARLVTLDLTVTAVDQVRWLEHGFERLEILNLTACPLGSDAAGSLARAHLPALRHLVLRETGVTDSDALLLRDSRALPAGVTINVFKCPLSEPTRMLLHQQGGGRFSFEPEWDPEVRDSYGWS